MRDTLSGQAVRNRGIFQPQAVSNLRKSMDKGDFMYAKQVLSLIILELWFRIMVDNRGRL